MEQAMLFYLHLEGGRSSDSDICVSALKWLSDKVTYWAVLVTDEWSFKKRLKWKEKEAAAAPLSI